MRRGRLFIFLALILLVGLVGAFFALPRILPMLQPSTPTATVYQVYHAGQRIAQGTTITEDLLLLQPMPETSFSETMFTVEEKDSLVGQKANIDIEQGNPVYSGMVSPPGTGLDSSGPPWASNIASGKTAITIPISRLASVGYGVADGAHVNVIVCMLFVDVDPSFQTSLPNYVSALVGPAGIDPPKMPGITVTINNSATAPQVSPFQGRTEVESAFQQGIYIVPSEPQRPRPVCQMIIENVTVLKLGNFSLNTAPVAANQPTATPQAADQQAPPSETPPDIVTLVVSPQEAVMLTYLVYTNTPLYLTLRSSTDESRNETESVTLQLLLSQHNITPPVKLAYSLTPRVDTLSLPFLPGDIVTVQPSE